MAREKGRALAGEVAQAIEESAEQYDQELYIHPCGSPACVAGFTAWVMRGGPENLDWSYADGTCERDATRGLQLTPQEARDMFMPRPFAGYDDPEATAGEAMEMLRRYQGTGIVQWRR